MMTALEAIRAVYRPDLKPRSLYPIFHAAVAGLGLQTGREYAECVGEVFQVLADIAGVGVHSDALGRVLARMHADGSLGGKLAPR